MGLSHRLFSDFAPESLRCHQNRPSGRRRKEYSFLRVSVLGRDLFGFCTVRELVFVELIKTISKFFCTIASLPVVIPAQAGIHVFKALNGPPLSRG
jgi:hypothetical protein